ncbi:atypical chemokine receptor 4b [Silurus meridionalis]|uniref:atypical chemokine receptor 4b n=1 Tax=Silurus meridionalis TaxID=175797 RepID=UPI001EEAF730|nr:atypical chemokine receptor 4b [Silurus meridionalis]KAI5092223.1 atypical chemokine receptor 4 isoform X1 [Silurus meridionalis]
MSFHSDFDSNENYDYHDHYNDSLNHSYYDEDFEDYTVCDKSDVRSFGSFFIPVVYSLAIVVGLAGNSMVVFVYLSQKHLRSLTDVFILNLAFADLLLLFTLPFWAADAINGWEIGVVACKITSALYTTNFSCSMLLLAFISVDRYRALSQGSRAYARPLGNKPSRQRLLLSLLIWIVAFILGLPDFFFNSIKQHSSGHKSCRALYPHNMAQKAKAILEILEVTMSFLLPFLVMMFCYYRVGKTLSRAATTGMKEIRRWKTFQVLIAVVGVFLFTQLPYNIVKLIRTLDIIYAFVTNCEVSKALDRANQVTESLALTHCCLNPVLYVFTGSSFKAHVLRIAKYCGQIGRHRHQNIMQPAVEIALRTQTHTNSNACSQSDEEHTSTFTI